MKEHSSKLHNEHENSKWKRTEKRVITINVRDKNNSKLGIGRAWYICLKTPNFYDTTNAGAGAEDRRIRTALRAWHYFFFRIRRSEWWSAELLLLIISSFLFIYLNHRSAYELLIHVITLPHTLYGLSRVILVSTPKKVLNPLGYMHVIQYKDILMINITLPHALYDVSRVILVSYTLKKVLIHYVIIYLFFM